MTNKSKENIVTPDKMLQLNKVPWTGAGRYAKLLQTMRKCNNCPFREKVVRTETHTGEIRERIIEAKCPGYEANKERCIFSIKEFMSKIKQHSLIGKDRDTLELQRQIILDTLADADINREIETMQDGKPGIGTKSFLDSAMKGLTDYNKFVHGEKKFVHETRDVRTMDIKVLIEKVAEKDVKEGTAEKCQECLQIYKKGDIKFVDGVCKNCREIEVKENAI